MTKSMAFCQTSSFLCGFSTSPLPIYPLRPYLLTSHLSPLTPHPSRLTCLHLTSHFSPLTSHYPMHPTCPAPCSTPTSRSASYLTRSCAVACREDRSGVCSSEPYCGGHRPGRSR